MHTVISNRYHVNKAERETQLASKWARRRDIPIAILAWLVLVGLILWAAGYIARSLLVMTVAALLAFALTPAVTFLQRWLPRWLAVIIIYLFVLSGISLLFYELVNTSIGQISALAGNVQQLLTTNGQKQLIPFYQFFERFGVTPDQLRSFGQVIVEQASGIVGGAVPFLTGVADFALNVIIVAVLSIYLLLDGGRAINWLRHNAPMMQREQTGFFLDTLNRVIGGYIRGQIIMSSLVGLFVGVGMTLFGVPYAVLLGVVAFILEFIPIIGTILSGVICVLIALSKGWLIAVFVLIYFVVVHILEGDILAPRIVGKAVGVHPAVSMFALLAGAELFGIWGAVLGSPLAGVIQAILVTVWQNWRTSHPEQFPDVDELEKLEGDGETERTLTVVQKKGDNTESNKLKITETRSVEKEPI